MTEFGEVNILDEQYRFYLETSLCEFYISGVIVVLSVELRYPGCQKFIIIIIIIFIIIIIITIIITIFEHLCTIFPGTSFW